MCINLRHLYGANPNNFPLTIAQFEEFFPLSYYAYEPGRIINMAITSFSSTGTHKDGTTFESVVNLPITTMTGKLDGNVVLLLYSQMVWDMLMEIQVQVLLFMQII
jgi:hypothetical protein